MRTLQYTERAVTDLDQVYTYLATTSDDPERPAQVLLELYEVAELLKEFPYIGVDRSRWKAGVRALIHGRYVLLYRVVETETVILIERVLDGRRDLEREFGEGA